MYLTILQSLNLIDHDLYNFLFQSHRCDLGKKSTLLKVKVVLTGKVAYRAKFDIDEIDQQCPRKNNVMICATANTIHKTASLFPPCEPKVNKKTHEVYDY